MVWLILGLLIWTGAHYFKRLAPELRASMGIFGKGLVAVLSIGAILLMSNGYKAVDDVVLWDLGERAVRTNNLLMLIAIAFIGAGKSKSRLREKVRHPMLAGALTWALAHLLVNGDLASLVLFGGLALWALGSMALINRAEPEYVPWQGGSRAGDLRLAGISFGVLIVIALIHSWIGPSPFGA